MGHIDQFETYKVLNSDVGVPLCFSNQQDPNNYTTQYPRLKVKAGDTLVANYTENGHVTQDKLPPDNKPHPGNYSWFWTGKPYTGSLTDGSQLSTFQDLNSSTLLSGPSDFDDGRCAESDNNTMGRTGPTNCQSHFQIPAGTAPGVYAIYWVWDFTKLTAVDPSYLELYTSCADVEVVADDDDGTTSVTASVSASVSATGALMSVPFTTVVGSTAETNSDPVSTTLAAMNTTAAAVTTSVDPTSTTSVTSPLVMTSYHTTTVTGTTYTVTQRLTQQTQNAVAIVTETVYSETFVTVTTTLTA